MPRTDYAERLAYTRAYRRANPERVKVWERQKRANVKSDPVRHSRHRSLATQRMAEWRAANPERKAESDARQRARQKALGYPNARASYQRHREKNVSRSTAYAYKPNGRFIRAKAQAKQRGLEFVLSREEFFSLLDKPCVYCGAVSDGHTGCGLDRLDNTRGYVISNVVPCCGPCNRIRGVSLSHGEMLAAMRAVLEYRKA